MVHEDEGVSAATTVEIAASIFRGVGRRTEGWQAVRQQPRKTGMLALFPFPRMVQVLIFIQAEKQIRASWQTNRTFWVRVQQYQLSLCFMILAFRPGTLAINDGSKATQTRRLYP